MINKVSFPYLGIPEMTLNRVAVSLNIFGLNVDLYWYAIIITSGILLALLFALKTAKRFDLTSDNIIDVLLIGAPAAIIGARLYYVIFEPARFSDFMDVINIRKGGLAIYGAVIAAFLTGLIYSRVKKINMWALYDIGAMGFMIGQCVGRWGNFINAEAHGFETTLPWGMSINGGEAVHPTFLYESLWNFAGFILAYLCLRKFKKEHGEIFFFYLAWYGAGRAWIEGLRTDSLMWGQFRVSQVLALATMIVGIVFIVLIRVGVWRKIIDKFSENKRIKTEYKPVFSDSENSDDDKQNIIETEIKDNGNDN